MEYLRYYNIEDICKHVGGESGYYIVNKLNEEADKNIRDLTVFVVLIDMLDLLMLFL